MLFAMFGLGPMEIGVILLLAVLLFGSKLPSIMKNLGKSIPSFKKGMAEADAEIEDIKRTVRESTASATHELSSVSRTLDRTVDDVKANVARATGNR